jgi:lipid-binding SYLF domain-containing protein
MKIVAQVFLVCLGLISTLWAESGDTEKKRVEESGKVIQELAASPAKGIPSDLLGGASCVIVIPGMKKAALGVGASYGRGVMTCRTGEDFKGPWGAPIMMASSKGSVGLQLGAEATDFVILVMNDQGARSLMHSKLKLGADTGIAAGPVGRSGEYATTARGAQMLSYSRSKGVFGGVSLSGATLKVDDDANKNLYGEKISGEQIQKGEGVTTPPEAQTLIDTLNQATEKAAQQK